MRDNNVLNPFYSGTRPTTRKPGDRGNSSSSSRGSSRGSRGGGLLPTGSERFTR